MNIFQLYQESPTTQIALNAKRLRPHLENNFLLLESQGILQSSSCKMQGESILDT